MIKVLSHFDLDGIGCVINIWNAIKNKNNFEYKLTTYNYLDSSLNKLLTKNTDILWVTDLNFSEEQYENLTNISKSVNVFYIDHHLYQYEIKKSNIFNRIDKRYCGSVNTFFFLSSLSKNKKTFWEDNKEKLVELNKIINIYDLWQKDNPIFFEKAIPLNDLFWEYKFEKFFKKFSNGYILDDEDLEVIELKKNEREIYLKESYDSFSITDFNTKSLFILNPNHKFNNDYTLYYPDFDFYVIYKGIEKEKITFSIRINSRNNFTIVKILEELKNKNIDFEAGGHEKSGGIVINKNNLDEFIEKINEIFGELND